MADATAKISVDISGLKREINEANKAIKLAGATFKAESASLGKWSESADGLTAKLEQLDTVLKTHKDVLNMLQNELKRQEAEYAKNEKAADEYKAKLQELKEQGRENTSEYDKYISKLELAEDAMESSAKQCDALKLAVLEEQGAVGETESAIAHYTTAQKNLEKESSSLSATVDKQEKELADLKKEYIDIAASQGKDSAEAKELASQIDKLSSELKTNKTALSDAEKEADKLDKSFSQVENSTNNLTSKLAGGLKKGLMIAGTSILALGAGAIAAAKKAVESYAEYEQLVGGVETLFKDSASIVKEYANNAFNSAGLSANAYMETVTGFSASLLQSLSGDTEKAASYADMAITDMSDNANKMGTDIGMIQSAYQGFAKQNYTMLDNLKLGYGGTKTEMERLIEDANRLKVANGEMGNLSVDSFADITEAIHLIQNEMGITGTTAKEASETISGSANAMKSAWQNLLTGIADPNQNLDGLVQSFISSVATFVKNLAPVVMSAFDGILKTVETLLPQIPQAVQAMLPMIIDGVSNITQGIIAILPQIINAVLAMLPQITNAILDMLPQILDAGIQIILSLINGIAAGLPQLLPKVADIIIQIAEGLIDHLDEILDAAIKIVIALAEGLIDALPRLIEKLPEIILAISQFLTDPATLAKITVAAVKLMLALVKGILQTVIAFKEAGERILEGLWNGIKDKIGWLKDKVKGVINKIKSWFTGKQGFDEHSPSKWSEQVGAYISEGLAIGIEKTSDKALKALSNLVTDSRTEVQKAMDDMNKVLLDSEKFYNSESERLKDSKEESDKKYLDALKEKAEKERKIYDAEVKDAENAKNRIIEVFNTMTSDFFTKIDDLKKFQDDFAKKLNDSVTLFQTNTATFGGFTETWYSVADLPKQTKQLEDFYDLLMRVKNKGNIPPEFFGMLRDMSIDEATKASQALLSLSDSEFNAYFQNWQHLRDVEAKIAKDVYADEASELVDTINQQFNEIANNFLKIGENSADEFENGFTEKLREVLRGIRQQINSALGGVLPETSLSFDKNAILSSANGMLSGVSAGNSSSVSNQKNMSFTQNIYAPKQPSRIELYRQTKNLLALAGRGV